MRAEKEDILRAEGRKEGRLLKQRRELEKEDILRSEGRKEGGKGSKGERCLEG